jgi:hypothetical protein
MRELPEETIMKLWENSSHGTDRETVEMIYRQAYEDGLRDAQALEKAYMKAHSALELIATPKRPDGTWNRDREACRDVAAKTLAHLRQDFNALAQGLEHSDRPSGAEG